MATWLCKRYGETMNTCTSYAKWTVPVDGTSGRYKQNVSAPVKLLQHVADIRGLH